MAGRVPRMRTPKARQIIGTGDIRLEPAQDLGTRKVIDELKTAITSSTATGLRIVTYIATGAEGVDFRVPLGITLTSLYEVGLLGIAGAANLPVCDFPTGAGDRATTDFRVLAAAPLTVGDVLKFSVLPL